MTFEWHVNEVKGGGGGTIVAALQLFLSPDCF